MQKVLVFDVAASSGGALTVLKSFYNEAVSHKDIKWVFVLSAQHVAPTDNVTVKVCSWIKKSRLHRLYFDYFVAPAIVREEAPEQVLSLQNINIPFVKAKQITYVHQSIPFCDLKFSIRKNPIEWLYQNVICRFIYKSIRGSDAVVVQTQWMKKAVMDKTGIAESKLLVTPPTVEADLRVRYSDTPENRRQFFYPAAYASYKNHAAIIEAARLLRAQGVEKFEVILTLESGELPEELRDAPGIKCEGRLPFSRVQELYGSSVLLFPSLLETFGLPLAEAAAAGAPIIAADLPYANEVLSGYQNAEFFDPYAPEQLARIMKRHICGEHPRQTQDQSWFTQKYTCSGWKPLLQYIKATR